MSNTADGPTGTAWSNTTEGGQKPWWKKWWGIGLIVLGGILREDEEGLSQSRKRPSRRPANRRRPRRPRNSRADGGRY